MQFSDSEKDQIKKAVQQLEKKTAGELVPYFVKKSDNYNEASWLLALLFGLCPTLLLLSFSSFDTSIPPLWILITGVLLSLFGWFSPIISSVILRIAISPSTFNEKVSQRAEQAFLQEEVFNTADRIGILIFISELEREVIVLADKGINEKVNSDTWLSIVDILIDGIKSKKSAEGIVKAINECEDILLEHNFTNREKASNELNDELRQG